MSQVNGERAINIIVKVRLEVMQHLIQGSV